LRLYSIIWKSLKNAKKTKRKPSQNLLSLPLTTDGLAEQPAAVTDETSAVLAEQAQQRKDNVVNDELLLVSGRGT